MSPSAERLITQRGAGNFYPEWLAQHYNTSAPAITQAAPPTVILVYTEDEDVTPFDHLANLNSVFESIRANETVDAAYIALADKVERQEAADDAEWATNMAARMCLHTD